MRSASRTRWACSTRRFTYYTGFRVNSGEYKVMGLAPYGHPVYKDLILKHLIDLKPDGSYRMDMSYFNYCQGLTMTSRKFDRLFGGPPRQPESRLTQREMDLAASIQAVTEEIMLRMARHVHRQTGMKNLVHGRRRGPELRGQRPDPPRGPLREPVDPAGGGRRRRAPWARRCSSGINSWRSRARPPATITQQGSLLGPGVLRRADCRRAAAPGGRLRHGRRRAGPGGRPWPR